MYTRFLSSQPLECVQHLLFTSGWGRQRGAGGGEQPARPPAGCAVTPRRGNLRGQPLPFCHRSRKDFWVTDCTGLRWQPKGFQHTLVPASPRAVRIPRSGDVSGAPPRSGRFPHGLSPEHRAAQPLTAPRRFPRLRVPTVATAPPFRHFLVFLLRAPITLLLLSPPPAPVPGTARPGRYRGGGHGRRRPPLSPARRMVAAAARSPGSPLAAARRGLARPRCHVGSRGRRGRAGVGSLGAGAIGIGSGAERLRRGCTAARHPFSRPPHSRAPSPPPLFSSLLARPRQGGSAMRLL